MSEIILNQVMGPMADGIFIECKVCHEIKGGCKYVSINERMVAEYYCNDHGKGLMIRQAIEHAEKIERGE